MGISIILNRFSFYLLKVLFNFSIFAYFYLLLFFLGVRMLLVLLIVQLTHVLCQNLLDPRIFDVQFYANLNLDLQRAYQDDVAGIFLIFFN